MITIGLLYSKNDHFSLLRSEMLVGPMMMANVQFVRFVGSDIDAKTLKVKGEFYQHSQWVESPLVVLDSILDFSVPKQKRAKKELQLLSETPHSDRIDLNEFEILNLLKNGTLFQNNIPKQEMLREFQDILDAVKKYNTIVIKSMLHEKFASSLIISKNENENDTWHMNESYESYKITTQELQKKLADKYDNAHFIQKFIQAFTYNNQAIAFKTITLQRFDGAWMIPVIRGALATDKVFASTSYGAESIGAPFLAKDKSYINSTKRSPVYLQLKLQRFTIALAQFIQQCTVTSPVALEFNIVYDTELTPFLLSLNTRAEAPNMPGRTIEFYRYLTEFAIALTQKEESPKAENYQLVLSKNNMEHLPLLGTTIKTIIKPENVEDLVNSSLQWIDISIGFGGRRILKKLSEKDEANLANLYFSLRIGNAQNDVIKDAKPPVSILAAEEYIGQGLISWKETEYMRSLRTPLLQKQFEQAKDVLKEKAPDIIFIEDIDLAAYGLNEVELVEELQKTVSWLNQLCQNTQTKYWGVSFYNFRSQSSVKILKLLNEICATSEYFKYMQVSLNKINDEIITLLNNFKRRSVVLSKNLNDADINILNSHNIYVLEDWNERYLEKNITTDVKEI